MSDLASSLGVSLPTTTGLVDRLVRDNLAERRSQPMDRRVVLVTPTREGSKTVRRFLDLLEVMSTTVMSKMSAEERDSTLQAFERVHTLSLHLREEQKRLESAILGDYEAAVKASATSPSTPPTFAGAAHGRARAARSGRPATGSEADRRESD